MWNLTVNNQPFPKQTRIQQVSEVFKVRPPSAQLVDPPSLEVNVQHQQILHP